jgi:hypothetical protein
MLMLFRSSYSTISCVKNAKFTGTTTMGSSFPVANRALREWCNGEDFDESVEVDPRSRDFYGYHTYSPCIFIRFNRIRDRALFWVSDSSASSAFMFVVRS